MSYEGSILKRQEIAGKLLGERKESLNGLNTLFTVMPLIKGYLKRDKRSPQYTESCKLICT